MVRKSFAGMLVLLLIVGALAGIGRPAMAQDAPASPTVPAPSTPTLPVTVTDFEGNEVTIADVSRIVPLSGDIAEIVWDLGLGANIVAVDLSAVYPMPMLSLPKIGYERALTAEAILAFNPTVVIGKEQAGPAEVLDQIRSAGVPVLIIDEPQTMEAPVTKIRAVAAALGVTEAGETLATLVQSDIDAALELAAKATDKPRVLFVYVRGGGTQLIGGAGSVADAMITAAGGIDTGTEAGIQYFQPITAEAVAAAAPDVIIVPAYGFQETGGMEAFLQIPGIAETPAAQNQRIIVMDDQEILGMTPRTGTALKSLILQLHPELAEAAGEATPSA